MVGDTLYKWAKRRPSLQVLLHERAVLVLAILFIVAAASVLGLQMRNQRVVLEALVRADASAYSIALAEFRTAYSSEVVDAALAHGVTVTHDYASQENAIPLPATMTIELATRIGEKGSDVRAALYSPYPFPRRMEDGGLRDAFAKQAWESISDDPSTPYSQIQEIDGREYLRYATADRMRESCINCHNSHPDSPKQDWKVGDVRGLLEVAVPMDVAETQVVAGFWQQLLVMLLFGALGLASIATVVRNMNRTSRKLEQRIEERTSALMMEQDLMGALMESIPDNIYFKNTQGAYLRINRAKAARSGVDDPQKAVGKSDFDFFPDEHARRARADEHHVMETGEALIGKEEQLVWPDGRITWSSTTKVPVRDGTGNVLGTLGISRDITHLKDTQEQLRDAKSAAESANRAKSDFLANMSHEIRTPMNAIIGMTELVLDTDLERTQQEYLKIVRDAGDALLDLINDILDFSKIEAGKLELTIEPFDIRDALGDTLKTLALRAHAKGLELASHFAPDVPALLSGDCSRLRQVVINLVGNAIKFTESGEVVLDVACQSRSGNEVVLHISVRDTGIGVPAKKMQRIFAAFEQADASTTRQYGGTGLGLAISSRLVKLMGGRMWVDSTPNQGSTFQFTVGLRIAESTDGPRQPERSVARLRGTPVLVVDDNRTNRTILREMLTNWGLKPSICETADEALQKLIDSQQRGALYPLLVSDVDMPGQDGLTLVERIRKRPELTPLQVIVLTSSDRSGHIRRFRELQVSEYLIKPVKQSELFNAIVSALKIEEPEDSDDANGPSEPVITLRPLKILLAEDSPTNQKLAVGLLTKWGHSVSVVENGQEAVDAVQSNTFDVVLMDIQMPELDGLQATRAIRNHERQTDRRQPIVAMTAHAMEGDRERCFEAGMDGYVSKPIRREQLLGVLQAVLSDGPAEMDEQS